VVIEEEEEEMLVSLNTVRNSVLIIFIAVTILVVM